MGFVCSFFVGGKCGDTSGICRLNDGIEVVGWCALTVGFIVEVGQVEGHTYIIPLNASHKLADSNMELHYVDVDNIVGTSVTGTHARCKTQLDMESFNTALGEINPTDRSGGDKQTRIVNVNCAIFIDETLLVKTGKLIVLNTPIVVGLTCEAALDGGAEERGGVLHGLICDDVSLARQSKQVSFALALRNVEEGSLPQLCLQLTVVNLRWSATTECVLR